MIGISVNHARILLAATLFLGGGAPSFAQSRGGGSTSLASYTIEIAPTIGIMLPYDIWGIESTMSSYGLQGAYSINDSGALTSSIFYHKKDNDWGWTVDAGYRHEINSPLFHAYFDVGLHYTSLSLKVDRDSDGNCIPANCQTDSGTYAGLYGGSGLVIPLAPLTLARLGFRFYNNPQAWVLLSAGLGIRF
jgi:hypothetical protein